MSSVTFSYHLVLLLLGLACYGLPLWQPSSASAHPGGLDAYGCHIDRKNGGYHCHTGRLAGRFFISKVDMLQKLERKEHPPAAPSPPSATPRAIAPSRGSSRVVSVIDGSTLEIEGYEKIRLIGVATPETRHPTKPVEYFGKEASAFTARLIEGKAVRLEYDPANAATNHKNKEKCTLAYVFLEDGTLLNAEILKQGYGHAYTKLPFTKMEEFRALEREAREHKRGLWAKQ